MIFISEDWFDIFYGIKNVDGSFILFPFLKFIYFIFIHSAIKKKKQWLENN